MPSRYENDDPLGVSVCSCQLPYESEDHNRHRQQIDATILHGRMRGDGLQELLKDNESDDTQVVVHERNLGEPPYVPEHQLKNKYAPPKFDNSAQRELETKYKGSKVLGYGLEVKKMIAAGKHGIAALVRYRRPKSGEPWNNYVIKVEKARHRAHATVAQEEKALTKYKGAKHILQIFDAETNQIKEDREDEQGGKGPLIPKSTYDAQDKIWNVRDQRNRNFILLEHAEGGTLHQWLEKSSRLGETWPDKALWVLFKCLVMGLIGMAYPPKGHHKQSHPDWDPNNPIDEYIPEGPARPEMEQTVHFDIEPRNILTAVNHDDPIFPLFKLADFGLAQFFSELGRQNPNEPSKTLYWKSRLRGKKWYFSPEQFDAQWDDLRDNYKDTQAPNPFKAIDGSKPSIAGNYGMHTNVYQIGVVMWCAITLHKFEPPARAVRIRSSVWETFGAALQSKRFDNVDPKLREVVQLCMTRDPSHRPSLDHLITLINDRLSDPDLGTNQELIAWAQNFFSSPRAPNDEPNGADVDAGGTKRKRNWDNEWEDDEVEEEARQRAAARQRQRPSPRVEMARIQAQRAQHLHQPRIPTGSQVHRLRRGAVSGPASVLQQPGTLTMGAGMQLLNSPVGGFEGSWNQPAPLPPQNTGYLPATASAQFPSQLDAFNAFGMNYPQAVAANDAFSDLNLAIYQQILVPEAQQVPPGQAPVPMVPQSLPFAFTPGGAGDAGGTGSQFQLANPLIQQPDQSLFLMNQAQLPLFGQEQQQAGNMDMMQWQPNQGYQQFHDPTLQQQGQLIRGMQTQLDVQQLEIERLRLQVNQQQFNQQPQPQFIVEDEISDAELQAAAAAAAADVNMDVDMDQAHGAQPGPE
ncbi:hypothetical protein Cob_v006559 [Colletotrichum orbiculare MAFF 240422]|uniref:Protein kinase domain-containing protein n=1 Tax=Colletotrichum orbiculare (strain 104-T / ATCC 96160 / CBS 514.97 / LARS 414 / MAFF 240422) TaxID=1213857 RepID=N4UV33_COLOR|nr:hypothetical protein Cob_v006559 [Colletotrichum orbiculare MAFF 240422]